MLDCVSKRATTRRRRAHDEQYVAAVNHLVATGRDELIDAVVAEYEATAQRAKLYLVA
jgi:DNA-binding cell septation regulator SpoVG